MKQNAQRGGVAACVSTSWHRKSATLLALRLRFPFPVTLVFECKCGCDSPNSSASGSGRANVGVRELEVVTGCICVVVCRKLFEGSEFFSSASGGSGEPSNPLVVLGT